MPTKATRPPETLETTAARARDWCDVALFQGERLTDLVTNQIGFAEAGAMPAELRALRAANLLPGGERVEVVESYFFLAALRQLAVWVSPLTTRRLGASRELVAAARAFLASVPRPAEIRRMLEPDFLLRRTDLADLHDLSLAGAAIRAARAHDYLMAGRVNLPATMAALRSLATALGPPPSGA